MKGFIFRICAAVLLIAGITTYMYSDALLYRRSTFTAADGDAFIESMKFSHFASYTAKDGDSYFVVGGFLYPENDRNSHKNSFFKLYDQSGKIIASEGLHEKNCDVYITDICTTKDGFTVLCEIRGAEKPYGKAFLYDQYGKFRYSTDIQFEEKASQLVGTKYLLSQNGNDSYYIAIDSDKVIVTYDNGSYAHHIDLEKSIIVNDAVLCQDTLYVAGSILGKDNVPYSAIYSYTLSDSKLCWKQENITLANGAVASYSQIDNICVLTEKGGASSIIAFAKYFDTVAYDKYISGLKEPPEVHIDTVAKKSLARELPLYQTAELEEEYTLSPMPCTLLLNFDKAGKQIATKQYECTEKSTISALSFSSSSIAAKEDFYIGVTVAKSAKKTDTILNFSLVTLDGDLKDTTQKPLSTDAKNKTYLTVTRRGEIFSYTSINTAGTYSAHYYKTSADYVDHLKTLAEANYNIQNFHNILAKLPFTVMYMIIYITARIRLIQSGSNLFAFACAYFHKLKTCIAGQRAKKQPEQQ